MKYSFTSVLLLFFSFSFCQDISFLDVLNLKTKNLTEVKKTLLEKDFKITQEHYSKEMKFGDVLFLTKNKIENEIPTSISFYYEGDSLTQNRISFNIFNKEIFEKYLSQLKKTDFKIISSKTEENITLEYYKNETTTIEVKIRFIENHFGKQRTFYSFYITDNNYKKIKYY
jgi:hypothetical protein